MTSTPRPKSGDEIGLEDVLRGILASGPCECHEDDGTAMEDAATLPACQGSPVERGIDDLFASLFEDRPVGMFQEKRPARPKLTRPAQLDRYRRYAAGAGIPVIDESDESLQAYFSAIDHTDWLSAEEEADLARKVKAGGKAALSIDVSDMMHAANPNRCAFFDWRRRERIEQAGIDARQRLVAANLYLVASIAVEAYGDDDITLPDFVRQGNIGLMDAVDSFDPEMQCRFPEYATWWIRHAIAKGFFEQPSSAIRFPEQAGEVVEKLMRTQHRLQQRLGREATPEEVCEAMAADGAKEAVLLSPIEVLALRAFTDREGDDVHASLEDTFASKYLKNGFIDAIAELNALEREVIVLKYGLEEGHSPRTFDEIADKFGLACTCIRQVARKALDKLQGHLHIRWIFRGLSVDDDAAGNETRGLEDKE